MVKNIWYLLILLLFTGCSQPSPTIVPITDTYPSPPATNSVISLPTVTSPKVLPPQINRLVDGPSIAFDKYNSILGSEPVMPSQKMAISPDGKILAGVSDVEFYEQNINGEIFLWNTENMDNSIKTYQSSMQNLESIAFSNNGQYIAVGGCSQKDCITSKSSSYIIIFDWITGLIAYSIEYQGAPIIQIKFTPDDSGIFAQDMTNQLSFWNLKTGQLIHPIIDAMAAGAHGFAINSKENYIAVGVVNGVYILNLKTLKSVGFRSEPGGQIGYGPVLAISNDGGSILASGCKKFEFETCIARDVYHWTNVNSDPAHTFSLSEFYIYSLTINPNSNLVAAGGSRGMIIWDVVTGEKIKSPYANQNTYVYDIIFYPSGKQFAALTDKGIVLGKIDENLALWNYTSINKFGIGRKFIITLAGNNLNLRAEPSLNSPVIKKLNSGEYIKIIYQSKVADGYIWWGAETKNGETGWVVENIDWYSPVP